MLFIQFSLSAVPVGFCARAFEEEKMTPTESKNSALHGQIANNNSNNQIGR
jgi:hypothetical protein